MDFEDLRARIPDTLRAGASYAQERVTPATMDVLLAAHLGPGDLLIDLAWNIDCGDIVQWCHDHGVLYVNTSVELWDPYTEAAHLPPPERTLYVRHMALRRRVRSWREPGPTAVVEHGANPGLVSHWTKRALADLGAAILRADAGADLDLDVQRRSRLEDALDAEAWNRVAMETGTKVIHISERDTQIGSRPKEVGEFVNTWSIEGFFEEGVAPAELGWGTHERELPPLAWQHDGDGPRNQICLARPGIDTYVRSWVPKGGQIIGMVVRHGEAFTISDHLTVWDDEGTARYRPTVHYAYQPADAALVSLHELRMTGYRMQKRQRIMDDEIVSGDDELGVLLLGHDLNGWWAGSQLSIEETRQLVPGQNATTLQVAASVLGAVSWMVANPARGLCVPDEVDHREVLRWADPYLGPCPSIPTEWTPLADRVDLYDRFNGRPRPADDDLWQFATFAL